MCQQGDEKVSLFSGSGKIYERLISNVSRLIKIVAFSFQPLIAAALPPKVQQRRPLEQVSGHIPQCYHQVNLTVSIKPFKTRKHQ